MPSTAPTATCGQPTTALYIRSATAAIGNRACGFYVRSKLLACSYTL